jgi:hypothetical protein
MAINNTNSFLVWKKAGGRTFFINLRAAPLFVRASASLFFSLGKLQRRLKQNITQSAAIAAPKRLLSIMKCIGIPLLLLQQNVIFFVHFV